MLTSRDIQFIKTKNKIRDCANKLFEIKDYDNIIVDICKNAGVSVGTFYHYYSSKEDIINDTYDEFDTLTEETMKTKTFESNIDAILFLLNYQVDSISSLGPIFTTNYFKNQLSNKSKYILNKDRYFYRRLIIEVKAAIDKGIINYENAEKLTDFLLIITRGSIYNWCLSEGKFDIIAQTSNDIKFFLGLIKTTANRPS